MGGEGITGAAQDQGKKGEQEVEEPLSDATIDSGRLSPAWDPYGQNVSTGECLPCPPSAAR